MSYFKHVKSNVKGGVDVELGEKTIIVGPNGSGKSAIQNSLELATRGFVTDLTGREEVRRESDLFALGDGVTLEAAATMSDGSEYHWKTVKTGKSVKSADFSVPESVAWPVLEVESMLRGNAETQRKWLLRMTGGGTRVMVHAHITDTDLYDSLADRSGSMTEAEILAKVLEDAASSARQAKSRLTQAESTSEALSRCLGAAPRDSEIEDLRARLVEMRSSAPGPSVARCQREEVERASSRAESAVQEWQQTQANLLSAQHKRAEMQVPPARDLIMSMAQTMRLIEPLSPSACLTCGSQVQRDWGQVADQWEAQAQQFSAIDSLDRHISVLSRKEAAQKQAALDIVDQYRAISQQFADQPPALSTNILEDIAAAQKALSEAEFNKREWMKVRDQQSIVKESRMQHRNLSNLKDDCRSAMDEMVMSSVRSFEESVQSHLPDSDEFRLILSGKSVSMGFLRDGVLHTALSGAEWARLTLAIAAANLRLSKHEGPVVVTPKERAWDPATLASAMRALTDAPGQVLLLSPIKPKGRLPKGWTMVEVG